MTKDEQARALLVEIALLAEAGNHPTAGPITVRHLAGFKNPRAGSWCAAGLTAAMEDAGLLVPAPGTAARRGAIALLDFVAQRGPVSRTPAAALAMAAPGDIIAWLQHPPGKDPAGWRRGHVALIVGVAENSIWTVGWNEGPAPGRVIKRQLWRDPAQSCVDCYERGSGKILVRIPNTNRTEKRTCPSCKGSSKVARSSTVLYRKPNGMLYGIARPVAR